MKLCPKCNKQYSDDANFCPVDAARLVPLEAPAPAGPDALSAKYDLGAKLGGSRTGLVQRATDKTTGAAVAVKVVAPAVVALPGIAQRLERELKQLERVQSAGVAKVLASGKRGDEFWVATELIEGAQTLAEAISARGPIPVDGAAHLIEVVGEALIEAAQVGVVHRDLAPKNVLFAGAEIKLINFSLPVPGDKVPGVPEFVAPEQHEGKPVDQRSNLYSLGALYYYVLTGHAPQAENSAIRPPSQLAAVPPPIDAVILRALDRSPTKRFLTVRQFVDEVTRVARGEQVDLKATQAMGRAGKPKAELVQTLLGVRSGPNGPIMPAAASPSGPAQAPSTVAGLMAPNVPMRPGTAPPVAQPQVPPRPGTAPPVAQAPVVPTRPGTAPPVAQQPYAPPQQTYAPVSNPAIVPPDNRSPWASPGAIPPAATPPAPTIMPQAPVMPAAMPAPMVPQAPVMPQAPMPQPAPPMVAAPVVANAAAGKKKGEPEQKGKFRETMWFKKGDLDAQAAQAAAEERAKTGKEVTGDKADSLPIDERYKDDGTISRSDKEKYSLRTGATMMMGAVKDPGADGSHRVSEDALIGEMKGGRNMIFIVILLVLAGGGLAIYFLSR